MTKRTTTVAPRAEQTWNDLPDAVKAIAIIRLTEKQLDTFKLWLAGMSERAIADAVGIGRSSVQDRLNGITRRLRAGGCDVDGSGRWYLRTSRTEDAA